MRNEEDNQDITSADKEQRVFSDFQFSPGNQKDFKQDALQRRMDELSGEAQKENRDEVDTYANYAELAIEAFEKQREVFQHKLYGYEVSETDLRKAATNILNDFDRFAARFGLNDDDKDAVFEQILLLQQGTPEQQEQAIRALQAYDPELAEAVLQEAKNERRLSGDIDMDEQYDFSGEYNAAAEAHTTDHADLMHKFEVR